VQNGVINYDPSRVGPKMVNYNPLTAEITRQMFIHSIVGRNACSAYANAFEFGPRDFATGW